MKEAFHVGQLVRITRPATGYADHRIYCIVCLISQPEGLPAAHSSSSRGICQCLVSISLEGITHDRQRLVLPGTCRR